MIKIELQQEDLKAWLQEQAKISQAQNATINELSRQIERSNLALTSEQQKHRVTNDKIYGLERKIEDHGYVVANHKAETENLKSAHKLALEDAKKAPPDASLVAIEIKDLLNALLGNRVDKIGAIKAIRVLTGWGLKESKDLYEGVELAVKQPKVA